MSFDPTHHDHAEGAQADLPESPPGAPEGHDAGPAHNGEPLVSERAPEEVLTDDAEGEPVSDPALEALTAQAAKAEEYLALAQRKQAEFENFRKRAARDASAAQERGATRLARELLPAVDNLERALEHAPQDDDPHGFVAGVRHVHSDLIAALQRSGIEQYSPEGQPFDPTLHEAVSQQPPAEGTEPGTVTEVFQRGYRAGETVVRPARVVVAG